MPSDHAEEAQKDLAKTYDAFKNFEGRRYTGMRVGGHHKWYYDQGVWKETKMAPDRWELNYAVNKRRAGHAPEGSGAAVGTYGAAASLLVVLLWVYYSSLIMLFGAEISRASIMRRGGRIQPKAGAVMAITPFNAAGETVESIQRGRAAAGRR